MMDEIGPIWGFFQARERVKRAISQVGGFLNWERLVFLEKNEERIFEREKVSNWDYMQVSYWMEVSKGIHVI
jgi:hypothetical protein